MRALAVPAGPTSDPRWVYFPEFSHMRRFALPSLVVWLLAGLSAPSPATAQESSIPSPETFFGFPIGADRQLARWDEIVDYLTLVDSRSERVLVQEIGKTTLGEPYLLAVVSAPDTIADLGRHQAMQHRLADPRRTDEDEARAIARDGKAVVLIGANVHATEIGTNQAMNDLVYQLATEESDWIDHVLANTIVLLIPSQNPDGQRMVVDWYRRNVVTEHEGSPLPELYHPYVGHDNNRDSFMLTQVETRHLNQITYQDWLPEVYLDAHQMGNNYARIFVPPFRNPPNPNVDPLVWSEVNLLGQSMAARLHAAGKTGVIWGELYSGYWQGANNTNPWWHNMVALLTEVASARLASPVEQSLAGQTGGAPSLLGRATPPLAAPGDTQFRMNYPQPWLGGTWDMADVVEYNRLAMTGLIEAVANNRALLKRNFYLMNRRAIDRFAAGGPFAFVVPPEQRDPTAVATLIGLLQAEAAEVEVAEAPFVAAGRTFAAGSYVVRLAQPFGRWVKDILEPQVYPDIRWPHANTPAERPYDITAWTLGVLMGVETVQIDTPFEATLTRLTETAAPPPGQVAEAERVPRPTYVLFPGSNRNAVAVNRLLEAGARVAWAREAIEVAGRRHPPGAILVEDIERPVVEAMAAELALDVTATRRETLNDVARLRIEAPRLALYEPWGGNIDAGWTRWLLDEHEFPYTRIRPRDVRAGRLLDRFDVIVLPETPSVDLMRGLQDRNVRPEYRGGIGVDGVRHLGAFVRDGGTLITLGNSAAFAMDHLGTPLRNVVRDATPARFFGPGSIVRIGVDTTHPVGYGMPTDADAMFVNNGGYLPSTADTGATVIAWYPDTDILRSGFMTGADRLGGTGAVLEVPNGDGRVILHTFRVQHRGQTWGTFKLLFNSIFYGPAARGRTPVPTSLDAQ